MRFSFIAAFSLAVASLPGCSGSFDEPDDLALAEGAAQASSDVTAIERSFGLVRDRQSAGKWSRELGSGDCYRTYWQQLRTPMLVVRFTKGAAFLRASQTAGSQVPALCVDLDAPKASLDGPALDAVLRHDLGALTATAVTPSGQGTYTFVRGLLRFHATGTSIGPAASAVASSLAMGPSPERLRSAHFIGGRLVEVVVKNTTVFDELERVDRRFDLSVSGPHATFDWLLSARRAAPRSADSLGRFQRSAVGADGPVASTGLFFERGTTFELLDATGRNGADLETSFLLYPPGTPGAPLVGKPLVECVHSSTFGGDAPSPPAKLRCTGL